MTMRGSYFKWVLKFRDKEYGAFYQEESLLFENIRCNEKWEEIQGSSTKILNAVFSGKGDRLVVPHIGSAETGLLNEFRLIFTGS